MLSKCPDGRQGRYHATRAKHNFAKTTHKRQYQQFLSMQQLVEGWVITLTTQTKMTIIAASTCKKRGEVLINMLLVGDMCQPARFENNRVELAKSIRHSHLRPRPVLKGEFVLSKEFHPTHLLGRKMGLGGQVGQGPVVSKDSGMLAINIGPLFFLWLQQLPVAHVHRWHSFVVPLLSFCYSRLQVVTQSPNPSRGPHQCSNY